MGFIGDDIQQRHVYWQAGNPPNHKAIAAHFHVLDSERAL